MGKSSVLASALLRAPLQTPEQAGKGATRGYCVAHAKLEQAGPLPQEQS